MSEITRGAIGMPFEMAMESELSRRQFHSIAQALLVERDQLKAENEALKAKTETYCTYGAEGSEHTYYGEKAAIAALTGLVFEVEGLHKALAECVDSLHAEMLQKFGGQLPDDMHPVTRREYDRDMAEISGYRAAMGNGGQS